MDLDDEELRATRKLLGLDKKEGIEEDIKILNGIDIKFLLSANIEQSNFIIDEANKINKAIYHLLQDYTRQKQINEEHQKLNGALREKIKNLEARLEFKQWGDLDDIRFEEYIVDLIQATKETRKADELFDELGYEKKRDNRMGMLYKRGFERVEFILANKLINIEGIMSIEDLKAINKKVEELKWI